MNRIEKIREIVDEMILKIGDPQERRCAYVHLYGVSQACAVLAKKRGDNVELAVIAGMMHDIYTYSNGDMKEHEHKGSIMAREILEKLELFTEEEISLVCTAIYNHGDKAHVHNDFDEILKDADVMQHTLYNPLFEVKLHEVMRYAKLEVELGLNGRCEEEPGYTCD